MITEAQIENLNKLIDEKHSNICQLTALKNGENVLEINRNGFDSTDSVNVMSVTKSVVSLLVGIAEDKNLIENTDQKVLDFFPDYTPKRGEKTIREVSIKHLLTMTAPFKYKSEPWTKICTGEDWTEGALDILGGRAGITGEFKYATLGIQILNGIIANASKMNVIDFANEFLFAPLGIPAHQSKISTTKEDQFDFLMSKLPKKNVWYADPKNVNTAGWGLCLSARDMAKLGQLMLNGGVYDNRRVISENRIKAITTPYYRCGENYANMSYGYLWWIVDEKLPIYAAVGDGGNVIYVEPKSNVAVGVTATFKPRVFDRIPFIREQVVPLL